ncbi:hypothetical protein TTHERM_00083430 (macronuclear) [Tetrahymena thermophila SB210]|uniref:Uncharacterized protein n=1 Tax=Tetrahymena thermophila (strain SB210) TaxID=312017 RepID=Q237A6_TETTS|nr:hypothetical protein TTHERM_00083430 [Tetrahymena thermophila SB210]EAR92344.2 hypothetical protein TTHERM_00083430 [Tetrahymena thermophila SB210]|eukprot:XP_001012589.2 hypothetical protein TTHERM_00083430 [Tetrahymena thermophila SB210]
MINPHFMDSYMKNIQAQSPPKNGQMRMFPEKFHTDKMFGQPLNRMDQEQAKHQTKLKNYGDIDKINQIYKTTYNMKNQFNQGNTYSNLHFSKMAYQKNRESSLDTSTESLRRTGKKMVNNSFSDSKPIQQTYQSQNHLQNSYFYQQQNSARDMQAYQQNIPNQETLSSSRQQNIQNNENKLPHTTIGDFYRLPSKDDVKQYQYSPQKRPAFVPDKVSCKKRFDERDHHDTTIVQLISRTSETGFHNDTPSKKLLKSDTFQDSFNHLFNQQQRGQGYRPGKKAANSSRENSAENYQFKNILTGENVSGDKRQGLAIVDKSMYKREEMTLANEFRQKVNSQRTNSANPTYKKLYFSNIFNREDMSGSDNLNSSLNNGQNSTTNKLRDKKVALYDSNNVRGCLDHSISKDPIANNSSTSRERQINRIPISNISNNVSALMISHEILTKQPKEQQDLISKILQTQNTPHGKMILKDRNQSPMTKGLLKNETMGTPQRFLLSDSSNKISSKHSHNLISSPFVKSTRNCTTQPFFN